MTLTAPEARVLGSLIEKQLATPQYYPLSLNALVAACNQSSNRDPVVNYGEGDVAEALAGLREKGLARVVHSSSGQRTDKYRQAVDEVHGLDEQHRAILAVLLLRGPQTVGELRTRTERLASFGSLDEVEEVLALLARREEPLAMRLERLPGQKEARWGELLSDPGARAGVVGSGWEPPGGGGRSGWESPGGGGGSGWESPGGGGGSGWESPGGGGGGRDLGAEVAAIRAELDELRTVVEALRAQWEG